MASNNLRDYLDDKTNSILQTIGSNLEVILETLRVEGITVSDIKCRHGETIWPKPNIRAQCIKALKKRFESSALPSQGTAICSCRSGCPKPGSAIRAWRVLILLINKELEES